MSEDEQSYENGKRLAARLAGAVPPGDVPMADLVFAIALYAGASIAAKSRSIEDASLARLALETQLAHEVNEMFKLKGH